MDSISTDQNNPNSKSDDTEISIFDAHKYFNEINDSKPLSDPRSSSASSAGKSSSSSSSSSSRQRGAHAATSEASWSSRAGLLTNINFSANCKWVSAAKRWFSGRKCCCNGEKCVRVQEERKRQPVVLINAKKTTAEDVDVEIRHIKAVEFDAVDAPRQQRISASGRSFMDGAVGFTFPIFSRDGAPCKQSQIPAPYPVNLVGDSLFGFRPMHEPPSTENPGLTARDDDVGSEASSDLFEIESFSTQTTSYPTYRRKDSADDQDQTYVERRFASANEINNTQERRRSVEEPMVTAVNSECFPSGDVTMRQEKAKGGEAKQNNGTIAMSMRTSAVEVPPMFALQLGGGRPMRANKPPLGSYHSDRLSLALTV